MLSNLLTDPIDVAMDDYLYMFSVFTGYMRFSAQVDWC